MKTSKVPHSRHFGSSLLLLLLKRILLILHITVSSCRPTDEDIPSPPCVATFNGKSIRIVFNIGVNLAQTKTSFAIQWYTGHPDSKTRESGVALQCHWLQDTKPSCENGQNYRFIEHLLSDKVVIELTLFEIRDKVTYQFQVIPPDPDQQTFCTLHSHTDDMQPTTTVLSGPSLTSTFSIGTNETEQGFTDAERGSPVGTVIWIVTVIVLLAVGSVLGAFLALKYRSRTQACLGMCRRQHSFTDASTGISHCSQDPTTAPLMYGQNSRTPDSSLESQNESKPCQPETKISDTDTR